jgi:TonB family protein
MRREKKFSKVIRISLLALITATASIMIVIPACSSKDKNGTAGSRGATVQNTPASQKSDSIFVEVDELPVFPQGDNALSKFIAKNTRYPEEAKKNNITGKVIVRFVVEKDCSVSDVTIVQGIDPLLDAEALKVISSLPKFEKPAMKDGKVVPVYYLVPIMFALK